MATLATVQINNLQGPQTSAGVAVPAGATNVVIDFDGTTASMQDPAIHVDTVIEFAPDGVTWRPIAGANFQCGSKDRAGNPRAVYSVNTGVPPEGATRKLRGTLTVTGGPLTTTLHIATSP